jgi:phage tail-like protein
LVTILPNQLNVPASIGQLGFMTCDGFGVQNEVIPYREGGDNTTTRKMPGQTDFGPITLGRGMMASPQSPGGSGTGLAVGTSEVYSWLQMVFSAIEGQGTGAPGADFRTDVTVVIMEHPITSGGSAAGMAGDAGSGGNNIASGIPIKARFTLFNAWPMALNWSGLDAGGNAIMIETLQLAHEGFVVTYGNTTPGSYINQSMVPTA